MKKKEKPLELKLISPMTLNDYAFFCKYFKLEGMTKDGIMTWSGKVNFRKLPRMIYIGKTDEKTNEKI